MVVYKNSFERLVTVIQELSLARTIDDITALVRHVARELAQADGATFVLKEGEMCHYVDEEAISPLWKGQKFPMEICISGWAMINRQLVTIEDIFQDPRIPFDAYRPTFVKSLAMVPIRTIAPIGAIGVYWAKKYSPTGEQLSILQALADSVSIALENLNLYGHLNKRLTELEAVNRGKDEFLMMISHELRTPLNSILGYSSLLANGILDGEKAKMAAKTIEHSALMQSRLINDILDATRIISGRFNLEKKPLDITGLIIASVDAVRTMTEEKSIVVETQIPIEPLGEVIGDGHRLQQIIWNLLSNAIKFSPSGSKITLRLERLGPTTHIQIKDNGQGIAPELLDKIFDRFYQVDSTSVRQHGGLGLGLAICKHLVEAHGGRIAASSEGIGNGAVFDVWLPLTTIASKSTQPKENSTRNPLEGVKALAVDDDPNALMLVNIILGNCGAEVVSVGSAREAMDALMASPKDILICDYNMPEEDGFAFMQRVRSLGIYTQRKLPAIALTAYADKEHEKSAYQAGFNAFIGKPLQPTILVNTTKMLLQR